MRYSVDVGGVSDVTARVSTEIEEAAGAVRRSLAAVDAAASALGGEAAVAGALAGATGARRSTGANLVARAGELVSTVQANAVVYVETDETMASSTATAQASGPVVDDLSNGALHRFGPGGLR